MGNAPALSNKQRGLGRNSLDWDKLRVFHAVAEAGSFTHAGEMQNLSQSAISRQISVAGLLVTASRDSLPRDRRLVLQLGRRSLFPPQLTTRTSSRSLASGWSPM